jgi:dTDP-4-dehydrorhamnose 3,5-epimerase
MQINKLSIDGAWIIEFNKFIDKRGFFFESFKLDICEESFGRKLNIKQANTSFSKKGAVRGIHYALLPPSQAKFVQCQKGSIIDFVVDIRVGSPTFGEYISINLDSKTPQAVFIEEGLAHGFVALEDETIVTYLVNQNYNPEREKGVNPLDKDLALPWPNIDLILSQKDKSEISLKEAKSKELLPIYKNCKEFIKDII